MRRDADGYLAIEDYGVIGNLRTAILIGLDAAIDWCCLPELDRPSVFGALLDAGKGGRFQVVPAAPWTSRQHYHERSNVLDTCFDTAQGSLRISDFMPLFDGILGAGNPPTAPEIHRLLACEDGELDVDIEWSPRFDYARLRPRISPSAEGFVAQAGDYRLYLCGLPGDSVRLEQDAGGALLRARLHLRAGEKLALVCRYGEAPPRPGLASTQAALDSTNAAWREWSEVCEHPSRCGFGGPWHAQLVRSSLVLKLLTHPDTGAIAAAATTSLPEHIGGVRNWDYRFSWIRDSAFTSQALFTMGHEAEARDFLQWVHKASMFQEDGLKLQIMYGLHGESELTEQQLDHLAGYRGSQPVRIGNGAADQRQHDIFGELLGAAYELVRLGGQLQPPLMRFLARVADAACEAWREPDQGIWEVRGGPRHFVYSKLMVWVALDRAIRMAERWGLEGNVARWRRNRAEVAGVILERGYDDKLGAFVQAFDSPVLDAANLLIPVVEFLPFGDPRVQGTIDRSLEQLGKNGLIYRYRGDDGLPGNEGCFGLTTFWMIEALAMSGRIEEAEAMFEGMAKRANHLGLYAEEFAPTTGAFLGNFPQAFTHVGFINSALYLAHATGAPLPAPAPIGSPEHFRETGHDPDGEDSDGSEES